jgi:putative transposase
MPRQLRLEYEGAVYHVMARGDRREPIFHQEADRLAWLDYLAKSCQRTEWRVYGWALMTNHYHLVVETPRANLVKGMQWLQTAYTVWFNRRHGLSGHLFGGRYKAVLIEKGSGGDLLYGYLGTVLDYVHLNPVRAGMVGGSQEKGLMDYRWSSLTAAYLCFPDKRPKWACTEVGFSIFGLEDTARGRREFLQRIEERGREEAGRNCGGRMPEGASLQSTLRRGWYFGSQAFRERLLDMIGRKQGGARERRGEHYEAAAMGRDWAKAEAERIVQRELQAAGLTEEGLAALPRSEPLKWRIAGAIRKQTTVSLEWIARRLDMGTESNVSHRLRRHS